MRLEHLDRVCFRYPEAWFVELEGERGVESQHFFIAEGRVEGRVSGRFRGANHPRRRTDLTYLPEVGGGTEILLDVAQLVWEPLPDTIPA